MSEKVEIDKKEAKKRIEKLRQIINHHRYLYHVLDRQEISDEALDSLKHELWKLEQKFPEFITTDSPTQRVGGEPLEGFKKVEHKVPMLSLEDIFEEEELYNWEEYLKRLSPGSDFEYFTELKIDGFAVSLVYKKGVLALGSTRGNGKIGEDVTVNLKTIESIPLRLEIHDSIPDKEIEKNLKEAIKNRTIEIRGEVYMDKKDFGRLNKDLAKKGEKTFSNPRNLAAGSIRQLDPKLAASRPLKFLAYDLVSDLGQKKHSEEHQILFSLGFKTDKGKVCQSLKEVANFWKDAEKKRDSLPFQIDGIVVNVNDNKLFNKLGVAGKSPRAARALKFSPKQSTTQILDVVFQIGRTGAITPVAVLKPAKVEGVEITRATLHNGDEIKRLGVRIGDTVIVERAGDVIPAVAKVLTGMRTGKEKKIVFPKKCPVCGTPLVKPKNEVVWRCPNDNCPGRKKENLFHFVSKKGFDIKGLGSKILEKLIGENLISSPIDIFNLKEGDLKPLERFAEKSAKNTIKSIEDSKKIPLSRFIYSLGIRFVGEETAVKIADYFGSLDRFRKASISDFLQIPDVGPKAAGSIIEWLGRNSNQKLIDGLISAGIKIIQEKKPLSKKLKGKTFVLTGVLDSMSRSEAKEKIRLAGGKVLESISSKTDFLIVGRKPGSKLEKAKELGVQILSEKDFKKMI